MPNKDLIKFILEARSRGFDDWQIREPLLKQGWPAADVEETFMFIKNQHHASHRISISLDDDVIKALEKRAKKNMFSLQEQVEDIIRRSCVNVKKSEVTDNVDDLLLKMFSRKNSGRPRKG